MKTCMFTLGMMLFLTTCACAQAPTAGELAVQRELIELRSELKDLRADIQNLVQSLKPTATGEAAKTVTQPLVELPEPQFTAPPNTMYLPSRAENPDRKPLLELEISPCVELTLDQCIEMALKNVQRPADAEARTNSKSEIIYKTKLAFWQLWDVHCEWKSRMQQHFSALTLLENVRSEQPSAKDLLNQLQAYVSDTLPSAAKLRRSDHKSIGVSILALENQLRHQIGWAKASRGQPYIKPMVARIELVQWPDSWEATVSRALENNHELQSVRQKLSAIKGQLAEAKGQPGYDKLAFESAKLAEEERQKTLSLQFELSCAWRLLDWSREQLRLHRELIAANTEEIRIYRERLLEGAGDPLPSVDLLQRASQRLDQAIFSYWMSVAEYQKSYAQLEYYCSRP